MGEHAASVNVYLIANGDIVTENSHVLQTSPLANTAIPTHDGALDPGVILHLGVGQNHASLKADAITNDHTRADGHVGTNLAVLSNLGGGIDHDVAAKDKWLGNWGEELRVLASQGREVEAGSGKEVLGLTDIHPEALQVERVELPILDHCRESLLLDRGWAKINTVENGGVEDVEASIDAVAHELDGLLNESVNAGGVVGFVDNDTVFGRLLDLGDNNGALVSVCLVESSQLLEWIFACDIGVEDEEGAVILAKDFLRKLEGSSSAQRLGLDREGDGDTEFLLILFASQKSVCGLAGLLGARSNGGR